MKDDFGFSASHTQHPKSHSFIRNSIQIENCCPTLDGLMRFFLLRHEDSWREKRRARVARRFFEGFTIYHERGDMLLFRMNRENLNEVKIHSFLVSTMNTNYKRWVISDSRNWSRQKTFSSSSCVDLCSEEVKIFHHKRKEWKSIFIVRLCSTENSGKKVNKQQTVQSDGKKNRDDNDFVVK